MFYKKYGNNVTNELPIRIVCATSLPIHSFEESMLGKSSKVFSCLSNIEILIESDNTKSLGEVYNSAIEFSKDNPAILVFVHDDVLITDYFWTESLRQSLQKFDIVGLAGTSRRHKNQCGWSCITPDFKKFEDSEYLSGTVGHGSTYPPDTVGNFGTVGKKCKLLDGLFLAVDSRTLHHNNLKFDPQFKFHFYDLDFCRQAEILNLIMGTVAISVVHGSINKEYTSDWHDSYALYLKKWKE